jgi:ATP-dependent RNA helicase DDX49/DBP8
MPKEVSVQVIPSKRQTLLFTATMTEPLSALRAANLKNPCTYQQHEGLQTADNIQERYLLVPAKVKEVYLVHVLRRMQELSARNAIVFCSKRGSCEIVSGLLFHLGIAAVSLHSGKPQKARLGALHKVRMPYYS